MIDDTAVKVVVRIRPQISRDILDLCHVCTKTLPNEPQIWIGNDKSYTFDHVFDMPTPQDEVFDFVVKELVDGCFDGYNATVLAYGQTGSGKTYTMGTGFDNSFNLDERGIIPRAVEHLFKTISDIQEKEKEKGCTPPEFNVHAQFMELYNEEVVDLLDSTRELDNKTKKTHVRIHEDADGKIYTHGVIAQCVTNVQEALHCLKIGSLSRTTASTGMNTQSSRSHAIFTLHIKQQRMTKSGRISGDGDTCNSMSHKHNESLNELETLTAKFHFVDLAGSERLKRTGATGDRQKESICINSGLLALGNVISALGDKSKKATHIPYRDSKLTRLLQDSLGGNSRTLMIACVSPSDRDFVETLSTLKYANRAKNIRNKVTANKDKSSQTINALLRQVENLQIELMEFKQGKRIISDGIECINDMYHENTMLQSENNSLKTRIKAQQQTIDVLNAKNAQLEAEKRSGDWSKNSDGTQSDIPNLVLGYVSEIEALRAKLIESENSSALLRKNYQKASPQYAFNPTSTVAITGHYDIRIDSGTSVTDIIEEARKNVKKLKRRERKLKGEKDTGEKAAEEDDEKDIEDGETIDDGEEEESTSESESDKTDQEQKLSENVADITCDITLKEKLIRMLEMSQRRIHNMKNYYEDKLAQLQTKILEAEKERDKIISNLNKNSGSKSEERKIRADYEKKISSLKNDVQQFENAKRNHAQLLSSASESEAKLKKLKQEVAEMKRAKVALLTKMKEEAKKFRDSEQKRNREIALLKKEKLNKESQIRALEAEKKRKDLVLKKRADEIQNLKKKYIVKCISPRSVSRLKTGPLQHRVAKQRWQQLENKINKLVLNRQNIAAIERDMDRWLKEREKIGRCLDKISKKRERAVFENREPRVIGELDDEIESLKANIEYIYENLSECQTAITGLEEAREQINSDDIISALNNMPLEESHYLIEKIVLLAIDQSFQNSQKEIQMKELESHLAQVIENNAVQEQLLFHVVQQANEHLAGYIELTAHPEQSDHSENESESRSPSPVESMPSFSRESTFVSEKQRRRKARNQPVTTEQLLFSTGDNEASADNSNEFTQGDFPVQYQESPPKFDEKSLSYIVLPAANKHPNGNTSLYSAVPYSDDAPSTFGFKPIISNDGMQSSYLVCSHIVEGHDQAVLCVECTDDVLFSSSEDGYIRIWDLATNSEIQKMNHVSAVRKVCYCEYTRRAFTASASAVKVWDVRQNPATIVHTFWASGKLERIKDPSLGPDDEINDISLNQYGTLLYAASTRSVQIFDLRMLQCIGALDVGYKSNVLCLAVNDTEFQKNRIVCGTEDKALKVFETREDDFGIRKPKYSLSPLHEDAIQALALYDNTLFSTSRDKSLRKWNLDTKQAEYAVHNAHSDWICALNLLQGRNELVTGCKSGFLKLWTVDSLRKLEEIKGHQSSINSISSNSSLVFTASNDCNIGVWKLKDAGSQGLQILS